MGLFSVTSGVTGSASLWNQLIDLLTGRNDAPVNTFAQISAPGAPTVAVNTTSGNLSGNYQYKIAFVTGYWEGTAGTGTFHAQGNTSGGTASATVSPSSEQVDLTAIPTGGTGVYERIIYRTQAGGTSFYYLDTLADNTTTTYTDTKTDAELGSAMPSTNTTGSDMTVGKNLAVTGQFTSVGSSQEVTNLNAQYLSGGEAGKANGIATLDSTGNVPTSQLSNIPPVNAATPSTLGTVEIPQTVSGGPISATRVADAEETELTSTSATTVATFTPSANGFFDVAGHFRITANVSVGITVSYEGSQASATTTILNTTAYTYTSGADNDYDVIPVTIRAVAGTAINVQFTASVANSVYASANIVGR